MLLSKYISESSGALQSVYPADEAHSIVVRLCCERLGVKSYTHIVEPSFELSSVDIERLQSDMERLLRSEPIQYVLGFEYFYGRRFKVSPSVLIPRPETEELVSLALKNISPRARVLDLCTGSGCIAWSIALESPETEVIGIDISSEALALASSQLDGDIRPSFILADVLKDDLGAELKAASFDMILSNPPYIMESEKLLMRANVLEYEPELALFVKNENPLCFYRSIAAHSRRLLRAGGIGIVEINELLAEQTKAVFEDAGYKEIEIIADFRKKYRFLKYRQG